MDKKYLPIPVQFVHIFLPSIVLLPTFVEVLVADIDMHVVALPILIALANIARSDYLILS